MAKKAPELTAERRTKLGSRECRKIREAGRIPAVIYGHGQDNEMVSIDRWWFHRYLNEGWRLFNVQFDGKSENVIVKDLQYDWLGDTLIHTDLERVDLSEKIQMNVELTFIGEPADPEGVLYKDLQVLEVECRADSIPDHIDVDVSGMKIGDHLNVGDIKLPDGVEAVREASETVVSLTPPAKVPEPTASEEGEAVEGEEAAAAAEGEAEAAEGEAAEGEQKPEGEG